MITLKSIRRGLAPLVFALSILGDEASASADEKTLKHVALDARSNTFSSELPHGTPFVLDVRVPKDMGLLTVKFWDATDNCAPSNVARSAEGVGQDPPKDADYRDFAVQMPRLEPNAGYCFSLVASRQWTDEDRADVSAAVSSALKAYVTTKSLDAAKLQNILVGKLGKRATYKVKGTSQTLIEVLAGEAMDPKSTIGGAWSKLQSIRLEAATHSSNARAAVAEMPLSADVDVAKVTPAALKDVLVRRTQLAAKLKSDKTSDDLKQLGDQDPAMPPASVIDAGDKATELEKESKKANAAQCSAATKAAACASIAETNTVAAKLSDAVAGLSDIPAKYLDAKRGLEDAVAARVKALSIDVDPFPWKAARPTYTERSIWYLSADVGGVVPFYGSHADFSLYLGISMNFRAVDKDIPLNGLELDKRLSVVAGITLAETKDPAGTARGVLDGKGVLTGFGLRFTDYLRLGGGVMFIRQRADNPLSSETSVRVTPFISASIDVDVWGTLKTTFAKQP